MKLVNMREGKNWNFSLFIGGLNIFFIYMAGTKTATWFAIRPMESLKRFEGQWRHKLGKI